MYVEHYCCGSCAVSALKDIGSHSDPVDVLTAFCVNELGRLNAYSKRYRTLVCFYVFCSGPDVKSNQKGGTHHSKDHWPKYGKELAQYIVDHELGKITTLPKKHNYKHHATSTAQVWLWSPNQEKLEQWWTEQQKGGIL